MARVSGVAEVVARMKALWMPNVTYEVGYTQEYAIYVHEDLEARHKEGTQAKFLEGPLRELGPMLQRMIQDDVKRGFSLDDAVKRTALYFQGQSQKVCPVDTTALKTSAFTRKVP